LPNMIAANGMVRLRSQQIAEKPAYDLEGPHEVRCKMREGKSNPCETHHSRAVVGGGFAGKSEVIAAVLGFVWQ
jgi:hypothetical protein